jgi:hypothetical protein
MSHSGSTARNTDSQHREDVRMSVEQNILEGNLADLPLAQLLDTVASGRKTGGLQLEHPKLGVSTTLSFSGGRMGRVLTPFAPRLTELMRRFGVADVYLNELRRRGHDTLEELNSVRDYDPVAQMILMQSVRRRHEMALMPIFEETNGHFTLLLSQVPDGFIAPGIDTLSLSLDIIKRRDEMSALSGDYSWHPYDRFELVTDPSKPYEPRALDLFGYRVLNALSESSSLHDLAFNSALVWDEMVRGLHDLVERGFARQGAAAAQLTDFEGLLLSEDD